MSTGQLPVVRIGRCARVPRAQLSDWIARKATCRLDANFNQPGQ